MSSQNPKMNLAYSAIPPINKLSKLTNYTHFKSNVRPVWICLKLRTLTSFLSYSCLVIFVVIKWNNCYSWHCFLKSAVRQGGMLPPVLFNISIIWIILLKMTFFRFPKVNWLHLTGQVGKSVRFWRQIFSGLMYQNHKNRLFFDRVFKK